MGEHVVNDHRYIEFDQPVGLTLTFALESSSSERHYYNHSVFWS